MNDGERHDDLLRRFDRLEDSVENIRKDMNGRVKALELSKARVEGIVLGGRILPLLPAYIAAGVALVLVLR